MRGVCPGAISEGPPIARKQKSKRALNSEPASRLLERQGGDIGWHDRPFIRGDFASVTSFLVTLGFLRRLEVLLHDSRHRADGCRIPICDRFVKASHSRCYGAQVCLLGCFLLLHFPTAPILSGPSFNN